jgi:hypothetical protein
MLHTTCFHSVLKIRLFDIFVMVNAFEIQKII